MFDAVLPSGKEDGRAVYIVAIRPNTIGFHDSPFPVQERHEGYAYDLSRCREALESVDDRGSSWGAIAVELCRFRAEWHMSATRGRDVLRKAEHIDDDSFESKFAEHLADWSSSLPSLARTGAPQPLTGDGAWPRYAPDDDEWESEDLGGLGWGDEELAGYDWGFDESLASSVVGSPWPGELAVKSSNSQLQGRSVELQELGTFIARAASAEQPRPALWLVDRDSRRNQPRLEQWASLHRSLRALDTESEVISSMYATDSKGRTRSTQQAALKFSGNDELRRQVIIKERAEYLAGVLRQRLSSLEEGERVLLIVNSHIVEFLIRHWFSPPDEARLAALNEIPAGLGKLQPSDVMAMYIEKQTCCQGILDLFWEFREAASFASSEVNVALLSLANFPDSDLADTFKDEQNLARAGELLRRYKSEEQPHASDNVEAAVQRLLHCVPALEFN